MKKFFINFKDNDLILHNMIFVVLYIGAILMFFSYLLWPTILKFKVQNIAEKKEKVIYTEVKKGYDISQQRLIDFTQNNKHLLAQLNNHKTIDSVIALLKDNLTLNQVKETSQKINQEEQTKSTFYMASAQTQNIQSIWKIIDGFNKLQASVIIDLPIQIQKASMQSNIYDVVLHFEIKENNYIIDEPTKQVLQEIKQNIANNTNNTK